MEFRRDNHYVPQNYLRRWADAQGNVWTYRVLVSNSKVPPWKKTSVGGVGYHRHLYTRIVAAGESDEIERWLDREFESPAAEVIDKVVAESPLMPEDWSCLARFVAAQDVRTPARLVSLLRDWETSMPELLDTSLKRSVEKLEAAARTGQRIVPEKAAHAEYFPSKVTIERLPDNQGGQIRVEAILGRGMWLFVLKRLLTSTLDALLAHKWTIVRAARGQHWLAMNTTCETPGCFNTAYGSKLCSQCLDGKTPLNRGSVTTRELMHANAQGGIYE